MINSREQLQKLRLEAIARLKGYETQIHICCGTGCLAGGSAEIYEIFKTLVKDTPGVVLDFSPCGGNHEHPKADETNGEPIIAVTKTGCHGFCEMGPLVHIEPMGVMYVHVKPEDCHEIMEKTVLRGEVIERLAYHQNGEVYPKREEIPFYKLQNRVVLKNCGTIAAEDIEEYIANGGYEGFEKALFDLSDEEICKEVIDSGLRGRGGAGYPTGKKWDAGRKQKTDVKYIVCNGDEGDPGAFMDRSIMEGNPHAVIEGMLIGARAVGSREGYIYVRAEYPLAVQRMKCAIEQAEEYGLLGDNILGTDFSFKLHINKGAGAFVCGEGSALTSSIEGNRGMPRVKPPRTAEKGLWEKPTVLNNVETLATIPLILRNGVAWYRQLGTEGSPGTKAFALTGNVVNTGLVEVPLGSTIRDIVFNVGGGMKDGAKFKAVQIGGPSGGCLTEEHLDEPLDFDSVKKFNAIVGSGGLVVMDEHTCMVEVARFFMSFTQRESCGKCVPCREGTKRMLEILERIVNGHGELEDLDTLEELANMVRSMALCGLGKSAPLPVLSTLKLFRDEYIEHIVDKKCRSKTCTALRRYVINPEFCRGCSKCARGCPVNAIHGVIRSPYSIDPNVCIKCGTCKDNCAFDAIYIEA